jgi:hypothetical protein
MNCKGSKTNVLNKLKKQQGTLFTIAKNWKQSKCPLPDAWTKKIWSVHTRAGVHLSGTAFA